MFICAYCAKEFKYESEKKRHELSHTPQFECPECLKKFSFVSALRRHQKQHFRTGSVQCSECSRNFRDETLLKRHIKYAHRETHNCTKCEAKFNSQQALLSHQKTHKSKSERRFHCSHDGCEKTFNFAHHLKHHELTHSSEKQHFCSSCGKGFIQLHHLKTHQKKHTPNSWLNCHIPGCLKIFTNEYALKRHLGTHKNKLVIEDEDDLSYDSELAMSPNCFKDGHMEFSQIDIKGDKKPLELTKKYKLFDDLSLKESNISERIDNVQNIPNLTKTNDIYSENINIITNIEKSIVNKANEDGACRGCDCSKKSIPIKDLPELKYNSDGAIKIKEYVDVDIAIVKNVSTENAKEINNIVPYNSCKAFLGRCIVSGTGTINEECLCAKMAMDDSQMIYQEMNDLMPIPCQV
ncbi:unnamed protein product [Leptosia nina]|uniref:C2H2-type domain-containing protein n=1 Tax=Leptosia nina TaxID=320188 RepID=A0AAV1JGT1_9NEOP